MKENKKYIVGKSGYENLGAFSPKNEMLKKIFGKNNTPIIIRDSEKEYECLAKELGTSLITLSSTNDIINPFDLK